jgi:hypothetical protein
MLQLGQTATSPQALHWMNDAYPRRLSSRMLCSRRASRFRSAASSGGEIADANAASARGVDDPHRGELRPPCALGQGEQFVLSRLRVGPALEARCRAAEHHHGALGARTNDGHLAGVIARRVALLVARLVLLVDDDRAEVLQRGKDRRTGAHGDALLAAAKGEPRIVALAVGESTVQHRDRVAEHGAEAIHRLRRERDLRHEHDGRLSLLQYDAPQELEVDERLPAARDAVQERHVSRLRLHQPLERVALGVARPVRVRRLAFAREEGIARDRLLGDHDEPARDEALED